MTETAVAMIVTDANKAAATAAINAMTPDYTVGFSRRCCALATANPTAQTPTTHWYMHATAVPTDYSATWQAAIDAGETPGLAGLVMFTALNAANAVAWAMSNLASEGLQFVPEEEV